MPTLKSGPLEAGGLFAVVAGAGWSVGPPAVNSVFFHSGLNVVVSPALIETDMLRANPNVRTDLIPMKRFGDVSEVSDIALMLARNGYMTGQTINVNGGMYMS